MWTGKLDLNRGYIWTRKLLTPERKFRGFRKYPDTSGRGFIKFTSFDSCLVFFDFDIRDRGRAKKSSQCKKH